MYIASSSTTVKFHEFPNGNIVHDHQPGSNRLEGPIKSISWNKDGNWLVSVPHKGFAEVVSIKDKLRLIHTIKKVSNPSCARFQNTTKKYIALGSSDGLVVIYDIKTCSINKKFPQNSYAVTHIDLTPKDSHIAVGYKNGTVQVYSNITNTLSGTFKIPHSQSVSALKYNPLKRNLLLSGSNEGVVVVWDINSNKNKFVDQSHKAPVTATAFSPINSDLVVSCGLDRKFRFHDIVNNKSIADVTVENSLMAVDFSHDGTYIVMASQNGHIYIYDSRNIQLPVQSFQAHTTSIKHLLFQPNFTTGSNSGSSNCSINVDSIKQTTTTTNSNENIRESHGRTSDLFNAYVALPPTDNSSFRTSSDSVNNADSFMLALGLDANNTTTDLIKPNESVPDGLPKINEELCTSYIRSPVIKTSKTNEMKSENTSTPKLQGNLLQNTSKSQINTNISHVSPIVVDERPSKSTTNNLTIDDIRRITKETVSESIKSVVDDIKVDMKVHAMNTAFMLNRVYIDLRMELEKLSGHLENRCNVIKEELSTETISDNHLMMENVHLRRRIAFLEDQLANMAFQNQNGNGF